MIVRLMIRRIEGATIMVRVKRQEEEEKERVRSSELY